MKKRKTPPQRKAEEYENEYRYEAWKSPHADRKNRPLKKALEQRLRRREVQQVLPSKPAVLDEEQADALTTDATPVRQETLRRSSTAVPLAEHLRRNRDRQLRSVGRKYFSRPYDREIHRERFARFLENVVQGGTADTASLAAMFERLLASPKAEAAAIRQMRETLKRLLGGRDPEEEEFGFVWSRSPALWLESFLRDEPAWREKLQRWIEQTQARGLSGAAYPSRSRT